jgi:polyisoprenoid-binding protein YceI
MSATAAAEVSTSTWNIDPTHTVAEFKVKHMMISNVKGQFPKVTGSLVLDETELANSHIEGTIDADSLETRDAQRDGHLKSADFFDVERFPNCRLRPQASAWCGPGNWP